MTPPDYTAAPESKTNKNSSMPKQSRPKHRTIAWNGISIVLPADWEVQVSALRHLTVEEDAKALMEVRWQKADRKSIARSIPTLTRQYSELTEKNLRSIDLPQENHHLFKRFESRCFAGENEVAPRLIFLYCPRSNTFIMLQFLQDKEVAVLLQKIKSVDCSTVEPDLQLWTIQDFRIHIPSVYRLQKYTMKAGLSVLKFRNGRTILHVCRLAPAAQRLAKQNLTDIFKSLLADEKPQGIEEYSEAGLHYQKAPQLLRQIVLRLQRKNPFQLATLWHDRENDRLLGIFEESIHPLNHEMHQKMCTGYEIISL